MEIKYLNLERVFDIYYEGWENLKNPNFEKDFGVETFENKYVNCIKEKFMQSELNKKIMEIIYKSIKDSDNGIGWWQTNAAEAIERLILNDKIDLIIYIKENTNIAPSDESVVDGILDKFSDQLHSLIQKS